MIKHLKCYVKSPGIKSINKTAAARTFGFGIEYREGAECGLPSGRLLS